MIWLIYNDTQNNVECSFCTSAPRTFQAPTVFAVAQVCALAIQSRAVRRTDLKDACERVDPIIHVLLVLSSQDKIRHFVHLQLKGVFPQAVILYETQKPWEISVIGHLIVNVCWTTLKTDITDLNHAGARVQKNTAFGFLWYFLIFIEVHDVRVVSQLSQLKISALEGLGKHKQQIISNNFHSNNSADNTEFVMKKINKKWSETVDELRE